MSSTGAIAIKPANMSYEEAAGIPTGGDNSLHFLRKADIQSGESVLVNGAGGNIGVVAVQLAKHFGAEVTAVDSGEKLDMLRAIGADHVIDYTKEDFTKTGKTYDVIFDVVHKSSYSGCVRSLKPHGALSAGQSQADTDGSSALDVDDRQQEGHVRVRRLKAPRSDRPERPRRGGEASSGH